MQENIDKLLSILESHITQKHYVSTIDLMWFLCRLLGDATTETSAAAINRLCNIAAQILPIIDRQVRNEDIDVEFHNALNHLGRSILSLSQRRNDANVEGRTALKTLLDTDLEVKSIRTIVWHDPAQLDWQSHNSTTFKLFEQKRLTLRHALNQEVHLLSSDHPNAAKQIAYFKAVQCWGRMLLPWFSANIYQRPQANGKKLNTVSFLSPLEKLINAISPFLVGNDKSLGWEVLHVYSYWIRDRAVLPVSIEALEEYLSLATTSISLSLVTLSYCARLVRSNMYQNNSVLLVKLCTQVIVLEEELRKMLFVRLDKPLLLDDHRATLDRLRAPWREQDQKPIPNILSDKPILLNDKDPSSKPWKSIVRLQQRFSKGSMLLIQTLLAENVALLGEPPGEFALLLLGSSSRHDRLPYSDIELGLIYAASSENATAMRGYLYSLLSLLEFSVIRLGETQPFDQNDTYAGFHLDSSDHILSIEKQLVGTVEELYEQHIASILLKSSGDLVLSGNLAAAGKEGRSQLLTALLTPRLVNGAWGGQALFLAYQKKVHYLLNKPVDAWTENALQLAYFKGERIEDPQHLSKPPMDISEGHLDELTVEQKPLTQTSRPLMLCELIALYSYVDVLRQAEATLRVTHPENLLNIKDIYHKPLVYLALNLQLFLGTSGTHPIQMFDIAYQAGILPLSVKYLLQGMLGATITIRGKLHFEKTAQNEEVLRKILPLEQQIILQMIERLLLKPVKIAMEACLSKNPTVSWSMALRTIFDKLWIDFSQERLNWHEQFPAHPLLMGLNDYPAPNGTRPSIDIWLARKKTQQDQLLRPLTDKIYSEKTYQKLPLVLIERVYDRQKTLTRLHPEAVFQLIEKKYLTIEGKLQFSEQVVSQEKGRHLVMAVTLPSSVVSPSFTVYLKVYPEMPVLELAVTELSLLLIGPHLPWLELARLTVGDQSYPVLLSQGIEGSLLSDVLKTTPKPLTLAPKAYTQRVLFSVLFNQEDAKPSNFIAKSIKENPPQIELVSIDNDRSFYPSIVCDSEKQLLIPQVKDITFCFDAMYDEVDPIAYETFLMLEPYAVLSFWLMLGQRISYDMAVLFPDQEVISHFPKSGLSRHLSTFGRFFTGITIPEESVLTLMLREGLLETLYTKIIRLQTLFRQKKGVTNFDILKVAEPYLASYYEKLLALPETTFQRFYQGFGALYDAKNTPANLSDKNRSELPTQTTTFRTLETQQGRAVTINDFLAKPIRHLGDSLAELERTHIAQQQWRAVLNNLQSNQAKFAEALAAFKKLPVELRVEIINHLNFNQIVVDGNPTASLENQKKLLEALIETAPNYRVLCLRECTVLTDSHLQRLLQRLPPLESLSLVSCPNVTEKTMVWIGQYLPELKRLVLQDLAWPKLSTEIKNKGFLWFQPMNIAQSSAWHTLQKLIIRDCKHLSMLEVYTQKLTHLSIKRCNRLNPSLLTLLNAYPVLVGLDWTNCRADWLEEIMAKLLPIFKSNTTGYTQLSSQQKMNLYEAVKQLLTKFVAYKEYDQDVKVNKEGIKLAIEHLFKTLSIFIIKDKIQGDTKDLYLNLSKADFLLEKKDEFSFFPFFREANSEKTNMPNRNTPVANVILYGSELIPGNCSDLIKDYISAEKVQVCFHKIPSNAPNQLSKKYFSDMVLAFIIFDANQSSSVEKIPRMAINLRSTADYPLPIVTLSITEKKSDFSLPNIGSIGNFGPSSTTPFREVFSNLTRNVGSGALLFHQAIIHQLETQQLRSAGDYFTLPPDMMMSDKFSITIALKAVCVSTNSDKKHYMAHYITNGYKSKSKTIPISFSTKRYMFNEITCIEALWDTPTSERFRSTMGMYLRKAAAIYNFVSLNDPSEFKEGMDNIFRYENVSLSNVTFVCIAINSESRIISTEKAYQVAKEKGYDAYFECSASTGDGIDDAFKSSFELAIAKNGSWRWLGKPYIPSAALKKGLILNETEMFGPQKKCEKEDVVNYKNTVNLLCETVNDSENNMLQTPSFNTIQPRSSDLNTNQTIVFKRLFFASVSINQEARLKLFRFFSTKDRKSFGCASQDCYTAQKEMDSVYEKSFRG